MPRRNKSAIKIGDLEFVLSAFKGKRDEVSLIVIGLFESELNRRVGSGLRGGRPRVDGSNAPDIIPKERKESSMPTSSRLTEEDFTEPKIDYDYDYDFSS